MKLRQILLVWALALLCAVAVQAQPAESDPIVSAAHDEVAPLSAEPEEAGTVGDPWERFNRGVFAFNQVIDDDLLFPLASAYVGLVPELVRQGITNVFNNFQDAWSAVNNLLQGKLEQSTIMSLRFAWNSTFGLAGILDMATELGMERTPEDFGQTLGVWGVPAGNVLVLPFFGPSTVRDAIGLPLDIAASPSWAIGEGFRPITTGLQVLDIRSQLLSATKVLDAMALDKYSFVRSAYLARRMNLVFDGNPPDDYDLKSPPEPKP